MATKGFEFAYSFDNSVPMIKDLPVNGTGAYKKGDLLVLSSGELVAVANTVTAVTAVCMEARSSGSDGALLKCAVVTKQQVWRCSTDASSVSGVLGSLTQDVVDENTLDADDVTNGSLAIVDTGMDDDGNVILYVNFKTTTFG